MLKNYSVRLRETGEIVANITETSRSRAEELAEDLGWEMLFYQVVEEPLE